MSGLPTQVRPGVHAVQGRDLASSGGTATAREGRAHVEASVHVREAFYEGPLPPAAELERYARVHPDAVRMILTNFEEQGRHRRELECLIVEGSEGRAGRGQIIAGGLLALGVVAGVVIATAAAAPLAGAGLASAAIGSGAVIYIVGGRPPRAAGD